MVVEVFMLVPNEFVQWHLLFAPSGQEKKAGSTTTTITNRSPTTDEKGVERGGKRLKTPTPQNDKNTALTAKVKQDMIDEAIVTELDGLGLKPGNTKATSISLVNDGDGEGEWTTIGKNNTPVAKEKMKNNRKSTTTNVGYDKSC